MVPDAVPAVVIAAEQLRALASGVFLQRTLCSDSPRFQAPGRRRGGASSNSSGGHRCRLSEPGQGLPADDGADIRKRLPVIGFSPTEHDLNTFGDLHVGDLRSPDDAAGVPEGRPEQAWCYCRRGRWKVKVQKHHWSVPDRVVAMGQASYDLDRASVGRRGR